MYVLGSSQPNLILLVAQNLYIYIYIWTRSNLAAWNMLSLTHSTWSLHSSVTLFLHAKAKHDTRMSWIKGKEEEPPPPLFLQCAPNYTIFFMYISGYQ